MEVELNLKEKIIYRSFRTQQELMEDILVFIGNDKTDRIIFKGEPYEINYKLLKKVMDNNVVRDGDVRGAFRKVIQATNNDPFCMIYKK